MGRLAMVILVAACSSQAPESSPPIAPSPTAMAVREPPQAPKPVVEPEATPEPVEIRPSKLAALQKQLGDAANTCEGVAVLLASQGTATEAEVTWRKTTVNRLCSQDKWPAEV